MSPIELPPPSRAAAADLFRTGGDSYSILPDPIFDRLPDLLPTKYRKLIMNAIPHVVRFFVKLAQAGRLDELVTDKAIATACGISERTVQYVLNALDIVMKDAGMPIINRMRSHGRRIISFIRGFVPSGKKPATLPPLHPPNTEETTTTSEPSSSPVSTGENKGEPREIASRELIERACRLIPGEAGATPGKVADAVAVYGADWVRKALDRVEKRNRKDGNLSIKSWGFVLNTLKNWRNEGGAPDDPAPPPPPRPNCELAAPKEERDKPLTPAEVADLVEKCQSPNPALVRIGKTLLRIAFEDGAIPNELIAMIPAELREPTKPRAP